MSIVRAIGVLLSLFLITAVMLSLGMVSETVFSAVTGVIIGALIGILSKSLEGGEVTCSRRR